MTSQYPDFFKRNRFFFIALAVLLPVIYIVSLLVYNYQNNTALQASSINRFKLDIEKQAATLGYFFLERKYDVRAMADSLEVGTYFFNRALGMSEQYGLKVSLFSIRQMMLETIKNKTINKNPIYKQFVFVDQHKNIKVNTLSLNPSNHALPWSEELDAIRTEPKIIREKTIRGTEILLASPCFFKKKLSGWVVTWLDLNTLYKNFMKSSLEVSSITFGLTTKNGVNIHLADEESKHIAWEKYRETIAGLKNLEIVTIKDLANEPDLLLITRLQIHTLPLFFTAYVKKDEIVGSLGTWPFLAGGGAIIILIALLLILFINTNTRHLILTARIDESKKQQSLLTSKNAQLKNEIIKRKQAEHFLKENEERYRKLFEFSSDAILILKGDIIIACNQKTAKLLGVERKKIINQTLYTFAPDTQPDGTSSKADYAYRRNRALTQSQNFEWILQLPDNKLITTEISLALLSLNEDTLVQLIIRDITERKRTQEILVQTEKMMAVGGLAAGMAHEINNPLGVILQANQNIGRRLESKLKRNRETALLIGLDLDLLDQYLHKKSIYTYLAAVQSGGERAAKIVKSMLDFGRVAKSSDKRLYDINKIIDDAINMASTDYDLKKKYDFKNIKIKRHYEERITHLCEKTEIGQVILNIIKNAAQAMQMSSTENPSITLCTKRVSDTIRLTIQDNGPGINEDDKKQIFEPFFTTKPVGEGTGLGLSVSYFIITSHYRGNILVDSKKGQGTKFIIELPT